MNKIISKAKIEGMKRRRYQNKLKSLRRKKLNQESKPEFVVAKNIQKIKISNRKFFEGFYPNNKPSHERLKFEVAYHCVRRGFKVCVEPIFEGNLGRADIYLPFFDIAIEILESESLKQAKIKTRKYPVERIIFLETKNSITYNLDILEREL